MIRRKKWLKEKTIFLSVSNVNKLLKNVVFPGSDQPEQETCVIKVTQVRPLTSLHIVMWIGVLNQEEAS